ncbi:extradiol ring-cleavage dioxygenase [Saccharothrix coeruleofusca]|uniref:Extradiol ring-cleavage dioxygenase class III enzyme subunit B domain-containing protein n=1 Tax=Saccharothrix coeruleofusca TaxID=33919 RepID=A0A918AVE5_9PSEU|nr:extradiol ring-cleavage dioxygenase [Saccharothrix coeruleofusca]MBP2335989.1 protocatechuate 4,5-dioxygenase beta chain [Saccharothrix coeruleofusca]GGP76156.1 hypothetical protein GCM10010185_57270 [Saccharothrix coeruleofusca]
MAELVAAAGVPHTPVFPALARGDSEQGRDIAARYAAVSGVLAEADADVVLVLTCDHINTFFLDAWPTFAVVAADSVTGPSDEVPGVERTELAAAGAVGKHLHERLLRQQFDPVLSQHCTVDHSISVPLHFLNPAGLPVVPVFVNGMVGPLPSAARCRAFGDAIRNAVADLPPMRVAVVASGSFSLEVGGPRMDRGKLYGIPDPGWAARVSEHLAAGRLDQLADEATTAQIERAGSVSGELLPWIAMAEAARDLPLSVLDHRPGEGHAFAAWS